MSELSAHDITPSLRLGHVWVFAMKLLDLFRCIGYILNRFPRIALYPISLPFHIIFKSVMCFPLAIQDFLHIVSFLSFLSSDRRRLGWVSSMWIGTMLS
jgi:hypothetical protein